MLSVIFFDLGSTLIFPEASWEPVLARADQILLERLAQYGILLNRNTAYHSHATLLDLYYAEREGQHAEETTYQLLKRIVKNAGYIDPPDPALRDALDAMYADTQKNWCLEEDTKSTLVELLEQGYKLGVISNVSDDRNAQALIDQWQLRPLFEYIVTSAGCGYRKPHPHIFQLSLDHFSISADQAAMVGDTLEADILGGNNLGLYTIWITRRSTTFNPEITPDASVESLAEIPPLLASLNQ